MDGPESSIMKNDIFAPQGGFIVALGDEHGSNISYIVLKSSDPESPVGHRGYIKDATFSENGVFTNNKLLVYSKAGLLADKAAFELKELVLKAQQMNIPRFHIHRLQLFPVQSGEAIRAIRCGFSHERPRLIASGTLSFMFPCAGVEPGLPHLDDPFDLAANMIQIPLAVLLTDEGLKGVSDGWQTDYGFLCSAVWVMAMANKRTLDQAQESTDSHSCYRAAETIQRRMGAHGLPGTCEMTYALAVDLQTAFGDWYDSNPSAGTLLGIRAVHGHMMMSNRFTFLDSFLCECFLEALWRQKRIDDSAYESAAESAAESASESASETAETSSTNASTLPNKERSPPGS